MQPPRVPHLLRVPTGTTLVEPSDSRTPGAGRGHLHHGLGMVGNGVLQALVRRRDAAGGAVVVGAVVQAGAPVAGRVHHRRDGRDAVGAEDRLRGLHLDLEPQPAGGEPVQLLQPLAHLDRRPHLVGRGDLGQGDQEAVRQPTGVEHGAEDEIERPQAAPAGRRLQALDSDAGERRRRPAP